LSDPLDISAEEQLIQAYKETQSLDVLGKLYAPQMHLVYGLCLKYLKEPADAQDAVMVIFELLIDKLLQHEVTHFKSWLYIVSKNHCLMQLRSSRRNQTSSLENSEALFMENQYQMHPSDDPLSVEDNLEKLKECINKLKSAQKECVELFYLEKKSYQEIVALTPHEIKKVKSYIQNGKRNLKLCMEGNE
jgi:RNA polymerase sigma-70 factor (ECF subfamily)